MKPCCEQHELAGTLIEQPRDPERPEVLVRTCPECGCRHIEVNVEPGVIGLRGAGL